MICAMTYLNLLEDHHAEMIAGGYWFYQPPAISIDQENKAITKNTTLGLAASGLAFGTPSSVFAVSNVNTILQGNSVGTVVNGLGM